MDTKTQLSRGALQLQKTEAELNRMGRKVVALGALNSELLAMLEEIAKFAKHDTHAFAPCEDPKCRVARVKALIAKARGGK